MKDTDSDKLLSRNALVKSFFPNFRIDDEQGSQNNEHIIFGPDKILPYLQTIFFEEHLVEIQIDHFTRIFFASLLDEVPASVEQDEKSEAVLLEQDYELGSYLKEESTFILTPLTPGIGNAHIRNSKHVILRYYSGTVANELGCIFQQQDIVQGIPVLRFHYPKIGRVTKINRPYRVKAISTVEAYVCEQNPRQSGEPETCYNIVDISAGGAAFQALSQETAYGVDESIQFTVRVKDINDLKISGTVRSVNNLRNKSGYAIIYGVQFDLESRALAAEIEQLVAAIQRLHIRELSEKMSDLRGVRIMR